MYKTLRPAYYLPEMTRSSTNPLHTAYMALLNVSEEKSEYLRAGEISAITPFTMVERLAFVVSPDTSIREDRKRSIGDASSVAIVEPYATPSNTLQNYEKRLSCDEDESLQEVIKTEKQKWLPGIVGVSKKTILVQLSIITILTINKSNGVLPFDPDCHNRASILTSITDKQSCRSREGEEEPSCYV